MSQLSLLLQIIASRMKAQEFFLLLKNKRKVIRQGYYDDEANMILALCNELHLNLVKSTFAIKLAEDGFANKGVKAKTGMCFYYISKNPNLAVEAKEAEANQDHKKLGELLDYPTCCIKYFRKIFSQDNTNPQHKPTRWETNLDQRENDWCVLSHFPCETNCEKSILLAQEYYEAIRADNGDWAKELKQNLEKF